MVNNTHSRAQYPSRPADWYPGRMGVEYRSEDGRYTESSETRGRPWTINRGLTELCGIPGRTFFVAAEDNGKVICLSTPFGSSQLDHDVFFNSDAFIREVNRIQQVDTQSFDESELGFNAETGVGVPERTTALDRSRYPNSAAGNRTNDAARRPKKRARAGNRQRGNAVTQQDQMSMGTLQPTKGIRIGDSDAVYAFYDHRLKCCQQTACKHIAKAWVKAVAPKKQSTNPYTRGDKTRPSWWPETYCKLGEDTYNHMRHKEPDHLGKDERVYLLCHILRMLVEPAHKQHPAIRKVGLTLDQLESQTYETLSSFFNDKDTPANMEKKLLLKEMFKVAKQEARYKDGELDGNTEVFVKTIPYDEAGQGSVSDSEDEEYFDRTCTPASSVEPQGPQLMMSQATETGHYMGNGFPESAPISTPHYPHPGFEPQLSERPNYVETSTMNDHAPSYGHNHLGLPEMYPSPQTTSRSSSVFNSPSEYETPAAPAVYSTWPTSNTPGNAPLYGFQSQQHNVQAFPGQMTQGSSYTAPSVDGPPRPSADVHHGHIFASSGVSQGAIHHQSGYQHYVTDTTPLVAPDLKTEEGHHPQAR